MQDQPGFVRALGLKVLLGFSVVLLAGVFAGISNFLSLNRLVDAISILARPDEKIVHSHQLLDHLSNEESNVRAYTLTQDTQYVDAYHRFSDSVHYAISNLRVATLDNPQQATLADSIQLLVNECEELMNQFVARRREEIDSQLMRKISVLSGNTKQGKIIDSSAYTIGKVENRSLWVRVFDPKGKKQKRKSAGENNSANRPLPDSSVFNNPEEKSSDLKTLIQQQEATLNKKLKEWGGDELVLLQQVRDLMNNIRLKISLLENNENIINTRRAAAAAKVAGNASRIMTYIGILGILTTLLFIYLILTDISRSKRLHAQLIEERTRAEKLAKVKEEFLANMSHEIRTPLNAIVGFADQLGQDEQSSKHKKFTNAIQRSAAHLLSLVNQVLDFSKIEAGKQQHDEEPFNFHQLIHDLHDTFRMKAVEKNIWFSYRIDENVPEFVSGDSLSVKQIIINLVGNALKFTEHGGVIINCILEEENDEMVTIRTDVKDTGIGIPLEMTQKIFEEFTQRDYAITRKYGGSGLGLTITRKLTEFLRGTIEVQSEAGAGSVFIVKLPFKKCDKLQNIISEVPALNFSYTFTGKTALIADDEEMNVMLCKTILEKWGMKTICVHDGSEALEKFNTTGFDVVLLDVQMPLMSGIEVAKKIRSSADPAKRNIPLIALTANVYSTQQAEMQSAGFSEVIFKPFKERELLESMKKLLLNRQGSGIQSNGEQNGLIDEESEKPLFSLAYLQETSGSNKAFVISMAHSFINNNRRHLKLLHEAMHQKDRETLRQVAHKMIPSYRYLQIEATEEKLKQLEELSAESYHPAIPALIQQISEVTEKVFEMLEKEIKETERMDGQSIYEDNMVTNQLK
ncbi:MAG: ATP-binding protein [Chitinophagales bacterium]